MTATWLIAALLALASVCAGSPAEARTRELGAPCRAKQVLAGRVVRDRKTGQDRLVLTTSNEDTNVSLIFIDPKTGKSEVYRAPAGQGAWGLLEVPGDLLAVGTYYDGKFMTFDLQRMAYGHVGSIPKEEYVWTLAPGSDGRVYGGTYPGGKLGAFDLKTGAVEDCGAPSPPNMYLRQTTATHDGRILCSFGMEKPDVQLYDPQTRHFDAVPPTMVGATNLGAWNGYTVVGSRAFRGRELAEVTPLPFPAPPAAQGAWYVDTQMTTASLLVLRQGQRVYTYRAGGTQLTLAANADLRGGILYAVGSDGVVYGVRGQDYFALRPGDATPELRPIEGDGGPRPIMFLKLDEAGRLWGGPHFGQTLFHMNARTGKAVNTSAVSDSGGEVYDVAFRGGEVFAVAYAGGEVIRYDPAKPWDQWGHANPRPLVALNARGYIRPTGGVMFAADGRLVSGWMARYGVYGGAIAVTDPETGKTDLLENPLGEQAVTGLAVNGSTAYVGTGLGANGMPEKKGETARFGIVDLASRKVVSQQDVPGAKVVRNFQFDGKTGRLALLVNDAMRIYDAASARFLDLPADTPTQTCNMACAPGAGVIFYAHEKNVIALDMAKCRWRKIAQLPANVTNIAGAARGSLYVTCGATVHRVSR